MRKTIVSSVCLFLLLSVLYWQPSTCTAFEIGARGNFWIADITGNLQGNNGASGTVLDFSDDLDMGFHGVPFGEAFAGLGRHRFTLGVTYYDQEGSKDAGKDVVFGKTTFPAGTELSTNFQWAMLEMEYAFTLLDLENVLAGFSVDAFLAGRYQTGQISIEGGGQRATRAISWFRPMGGVGLHLGFLADILEFRMKAGGILLSEEHMIDALGELSLTPFPFMDIAVGYRYLSIKVDSNGLEQDYDLMGPYAGLTLSF
ncbi:MAG: hypothetical protein HY788_05790 [Deltaproteobacteria bacterium]|nr:hypothetical protein [Deltaproteobacteria bacterium]